VLKFLECVEQVDALWQGHVICCQPATGQPQVWYLVVVGEVKFHDCRFRSSRGEAYPMKTIAVLAA
jgi:hypothetical protein